MEGAVVFRHANIDDGKDELVSIVIFHINTFGGVYSHWSGSSLIVISNIAHENWSPLSG